MKNVETYVITPMKPNFSDSELKTLGIIYPYDSSNAMENPDLTEFHCIEGKRNETILFKKDIDLGFIADFCKGKNFYKIELIWRDNLVETINNAYLEEDTFMEDLEFYVNHKFTQSSGAARTYEFKGVA